MDVTLQASLSARDAEDFDRFATEAKGGHYTQTRRWADVAIAGRPLRSRYFLARDGGKVVGCGVLLQPHAAFLGAPVLRFERGPVCDDPERVAGVSRALCRAARLRGVGRVQVMPYWAGDDVEPIERSLREVRFRSVQELDGAHACTLRLAIGGKKDADILAGGERRKLRSELKQAEQKGARVRAGTADDVKTFARLHADLMERQGKGTKPDAFYDRLAERVGGDGPAALFVCEHEGDAVAAVLVVRHAKQTTFVMGASDASKRPFTKMAPALMAAIRWARDAGCEIFDLGGVPMPEDQDEKRVNIARFKFDFASSPVRLVGEHARWF
jgi:CelD/BcsL family acetyltransferase involved in cellulose biosynthesis